MSTVESTYLQQRAQLLDIEASLTPVNQPGEIKPGKLELATPRHVLPQFSRKFEDWPAFRDLFGSIVERDASPSKVEKLHYLKTIIKGDAEQQIRNIPATEENFDRAWSILCDHFENKRLLVRFFLNTSTAIPKMKSDSVADLRRIFHGVVSTVGPLEGIGRPVTNCSDLLVHLVIELLDSRNRREWDNSLGKSSEQPTGIRFG